MAAGLSPLSVSKHMTSTTMNRTIGLTGTVSTLIGYEVTVTDPLTFMTVSGILVAVSLFACFVPPRRASRVDPAITLRYE